MTTFPHLTAVIGLDPSLTRTGVCGWCGPGTIIKSTSISSTNIGDGVHNRMSRIAQIVEKVTATVSSIDADSVVVFIENYGFSQNKKGASWIVELGAVLRYELVDLGVTLFEVSPTTVKKWSTGSGGADKVAVAVSLSRRYDVVLGSDDEYDAYALCRMAGQAAGWETPANQQQTEALNAVLQPQKKGSKRAKGKGRKPKGGDAVSVQ